jgi:hypothetical protein
MHILLSSMTPAYFLHVYKMLQGVPKKLNSYIYMFQFVHSLIYELLNDMMITKIGLVGHHAYLLKLYTTAWSDA